MIVDLERHESPIFPIVFCIILQLEILLDTDDFLIKFAGYIMAYFIPTYIITMV